MEKFDVSDFGEMTIAELSGSLGDLSVDQLQQIADAEEAGQARKGAAKVIMAELAARLETAERLAKLEPGEEFDPKTDDGCVVLIDDDKRMWKPILIKRGELAVRGNKFVYLPEIRPEPLGPEMNLSRVALYTPQANDEDPRAIVGEIKLAVPLRTGGGRRALFPAGTIAFDIPEDMQKLAAEAALGGE